MYKSSQLIKNITTSKGKLIAIEYVTKTDTWERRIIAQSRKNDEKYKETLKPDTVTVDVKEAEHPSSNDPAEHFSAFELDKDNNVIASKHYYK
ncbi:Hypothetical predicted protein [Lecanosticta acicola]|uniref:Uncharacterized protein n=1 Tax=Lecanosticta acicola TaxID=111012 RepID=A0AAI9EEX3_9PEZI|nr:Hypothetical predicted protein [Lecanosticta acicola]